MKFNIMPKQLLAAFILAISSFGASAASITIDFTGVLTSTFDTLTSGTAFSGSYTYDPSVAGTGNSSFAVFNNLLDASLTVGSFSATVGPGTGLPEIQQDDVAGADRYALLARNPVGSSQIGGQDITGFGFRLDDTTGTAITNALTLLSPPSLSSFNGNAFFIFFHDPNPGSTVPDGFVGGELQTLSVRNPTVPEPSSLLLLGAAAVSFQIARGRIKKINS
jgi:hypothetical protein